MVLVVSSYVNPGLFAGNSTVVSTSESSVTVMTWESGVFWSTVVSVAVITGGVLSIFKTSFDAIYPIGVDSPSSETATQTYFPSADSLSKRIPSSAFEDSKFAEADWKEVTPALHWARLSTRAYLYENTSVPWEFRWMRALSVCSFLSFLV